MYKQIVNIVYIAIIKKDREKEKNFKNA